MLPNLSLNSLMYNSYGVSSAIFFSLGLAVFFPAGLFINSSKNSLFHGVEMSHFSLNHISWPLVFEYPLSSGLAITTVSFVSK